MELFLEFLHIQDARYAALAAALLLSMFALHFGGRDASSRQIFFWILASVVVGVASLQLLKKASSDTEVEENDKDLMSFADEVSPMDTQGNSHRARVSMMDPDIYTLRRTKAGSYSYAAMHPEVSWALLQLRPYRRADRGAVRAILDATEHFFETFYELLETEDKNDDEPVHMFRILKDVRANILNRMTALTYAKPNAHPTTRNLHRAVDVIKWRTYRALKTLHNKFGGLRTEARGPPYAFDEAYDRDNRFRIHA
jgi:hypothetical protein